MSINWLRNIPPAGMILHANDNLGKKLLFRAILAAFE